MENFGKFMAVIIALVLNTLIVGYTFSILWGWFIVTTFNTRQLTIPESLGLILIYGYVKAKADKTKSDDDVIESTLKSFCFTLFMSLFVLLIGWIVTLFM